MSSTPSTEDGNRSSLQRIVSSLEYPTVDEVQKSIIDEMSKSLQIEVQNAVSEITEGVISVLWDTGFSICCENNI